MKYNNINMKLKDRWKSKSPKWAKILGHIALVIAVAGFALGNAYTEMPVDVQSLVPEWLGNIIGIASLTGRVALQFTAINNIFDKESAVLKKFDKKKKSNIKRNIRKKIN